MIDSGPHSRPHAAMSKTFSGAAFRQNAGRRAIHPHSGEVRLRYMTVCLMLASMVMVCCGVSVASAAEPPAPDFQNDVLPLLKNRCVKCHGPAKQEGKLNLSLPPGIARGGETGAVIVPGNVQDSLLWQLVETDEMPKDSPLSVEEKDLLRRWIAGGAVGLPAAVAATSGGAEHWAFQKLAPSAPPPVRDRTRLRTPIDAFVQSRLEAKGLSLGPEAGRETLVRRVSLDLTGLPPTPAEIDQYLSDMEYNAYENMIERYLASPCYGERWGKHWLDAAGYADSNGYFSADTDRPLAYRYRDYVIRSLNADKPFDRFIREQLAGDELAGFKPGQPVTADMIELLEATHFLRNGQDGTDIGVQEPEAFEIDRRAALEAVVQVTATSLLGLTLHCARCHDHKFDPITQNEYYQFQAILFPAFNPQDWVNPEDRVAFAYLPGEKEQWESKERRIKEQLDQQRREYVAWQTANREPSELLLQETFDDDTWQTRWSNTAPGDDHPGGTVAIGGTAAHAARTQDGRLQIIAGPGEAWLSTVAAYDWTPDAPGAWLQATFDLIDNKVGGGPAERIGYILAAHDYDDSGSRAGGNLLVDGNPATETNIYHDYPGTDQKVLGSIGAQGYVPGRNYGVRVTNIGEGKFRLEHLVDGLPDGKTLEVTAADLPDGGFALFFCIGRSYVVDEVRIERSLPDAGGKQDLVALRKSIAERRSTYEMQRKELLSQSTPEPGRAIAWVSDRSAKPPVVPFLTRGSYQLRGPGMEPAGLQILSDAGHEYRPHPPVGDAPTTGRRLGLAQWITQTDGRASALLARVHVNRVWHQYFGRGIVPTTDNLGQGGAQPSHPELLEDLAATFIASGWSQKALHRRIVMSAVYRQTSAPRSEGIAADPDNRLWWRWPVRRLEAEVIRDGMLAVAGQLDMTPFGPYVPTQQTAVGEVVANEQAAGARRRSVYLQQRRSQTLSLLKVFDAPAVATVCTTRPSSTVPLQSLSLLNSDFALARGEAFARRILAETDGSPSAVVRLAWRMSVGRLPTPSEEMISLQFLATQREQYAADAAMWALADFCQMLLASNAFLYLE